MNKKELKRMRDRVTRLVRPFLKGNKKIKYLKDYMNYRKYAIKCRKLAKHSLIELTTNRQFDDWVILMHDTRCLDMLEKGITTGEYLNGIATFNRQPLPSGKSFISHIISRVYISEIARTLALGRACIKKDIVGTKKSERSFMRKLIQNITLTTIEELSHELSAENTFSPSEVVPYSHPEHGHIRDILYKKDLF